MNKLVKNDGGFRPMHAVLERYGIGSTDKYGRGIWISHTDLPAIKDAMDADPTAVRGEWKGKPYLFVQGSSKHNHVQYADFSGLFEGGVPDGK